MSFFGRPFRKRQAEGQAAFGLRFAAVLYRKRTGGKGTKPFASLARVLLIFDIRFQNGGNARKIIQKFKEKPVSLYSAIKFLYLLP